MAQLGNLLVTGSSRLLGKLFCNDISVGNELTVKTLNTTDFTANSIITNGLTVNGNATTTGTLNVGNSQANGKISINGKVVIRDYGSSWLGINDGYAGSWLSSGVYFGKSTIRTDTTFQLGENGNKILFNTSSAKFSIPVTINNSLAANNITATNVTINDTLKAFKYELNTIQDLGGEFLIAPTIYIQSGATVQVSKASSTTITVSILDKSAITSDIIQGVSWSKDSKIKFQGKIDGISIRCDGVMANKLNTTANTMALTLTVDSSIANHFATANNNASYSDISILLYQRYGKNISGTNTYSPVGIRMSATGSSNAAPYVDIWGSKSSSDSDVIYTIPSVRLGYLNGLSVTYDNTTVNCAGYGLYADNVYLNGTIISNAGSIGGFRITDNEITNGIWGTDKSVLVCTGSTTSKSIGGSASIADWCFTAGSKFGVTTSGDMYASNAIISGKVTATSGTIGGCVIKDKVLQVASANIISVNADTITTGTLNVDRLAANSLTVDKFTTDNMVGTNGWINFHKGTFNYGNGNLVWDGTELSVNGTVTATAGDIGGWKIDTNSLYKSSSLTKDNNEYSVSLLSPDTIDADTNFIDIKQRSLVDNVYSDWTTNFFITYSGKFNFGNKILFDGENLSFAEDVKLTATNIDLDNLFTNKITFSQGGVDNKSVSMHVGGTTFQPKILEYTTNEGVSGITSIAVMYNGLIIRDGSDYDKNSLNALDTCRLSSDELYAKQSFSEVGYANSLYARTLYVNEINYFNDISNNSSGRYNNIPFTNKSLSTGNGGTAATISINRGTYLVIATASFTANTNGRRYIKISQTTADISYNSSDCMVVNACNGGETLVEKVKILTNNTDNTIKYYLSVWQNSGSTLKASGTVRVYKLM